MKKMLMYLLIVFIVTALVTPVSLYAEEKTPEETTQEAQETQTIPDREELGSWWRYSAKKLDPVYPKWLFHIEGTYSFTHQTGNTDGSTQEGSARLVLRKNIFTNYLRFNRSASDFTTSDGDSVDTEKNELNNFLQIDITKKLFGRVGVAWLSDDEEYIEDRYTYFAGIGANVLETPKQTLSLRLYYGYDELDFTDEAKTEASLAGIELKRESSDGLLFEQEYGLALNGRVTFNEMFGYLKFFEESDKYRWVFDVTLAVQVVGPLYIFGNYKIDQNTSETLKILQNYEEQDTSLTVGISVSY